MTTFAVFVAAAESDWKGPPVATWDAALVQDDSLVLKDAANTEKLVGCALADLEMVRWCTLAEADAGTCLQLDVTIRGTGKIFAYASTDCLRHMADKGVETEEMDDHDKGVFQPLWTRLEAENAEFTAEIMSLVNEELS